MLKHHTAFRIICVLLLMVTALLPGCSSDSTATSTSSPLALSVNDSRFTVQEFYTLLKQETAVDPEFDLNADKQAAFMDYLIRKELLIQEASRLKLDHEAEFTRTIERYWESTLIRNLLTARAEELKANVLVTEEDILAYYNTNKQDLDGSLDDLRPAIRSRIEEERVSALTEQWIDKLKASATIHKNPDLTKP